MLGRSEKLLIQARNRQVLLHRKIQISRVVDGQLVLACEGENMIVGNWIGKRDV